MATIVRVKRRREEDPLEVLLFQPKLRKLITTPQTDDNESARNIFKFAGRVVSKKIGRLLDSEVIVEDFVVDYEAALWKALRHVFVGAQIHGCAFHWGQAVWRQIQEENITKHVRDAIRREKLGREYKVAHNFSRWKDQIRQSKQTESQLNRLRVVSNYRALDLDNLDLLNTQATVCRLCGLPMDKPDTVAEDIVVKKCDNKLEPCTSSQCATNKSEEPSRSEDNEGRIVDVRQLDCDREQTDKKSINTNVCKCLSDQSDGDNETNRQRGDGKEVRLYSGRASTVNTAGGKEADGGATGDGGCVLNVGDQQGGACGVGDANADNSRGMFCLVDMESENITNERNQQNCVSEQITCNSEPMISERVVSESSDDQYVYDIYYTNSRGFDFRLFERDLTFEAINGSELMYDRFEEGDDDVAYDDDNDDENDENNWRNDYPDDDPRYYENANHGGYEDSDMDENLAFGGENIYELYDWMNWKCQIDDLGYPRKEEDDDDEDDEKDDEVADEIP